METNGDDLVNVGSGCIEDGGLTKREYFAAMAMQGIIILNKPDFEKAGELAVLLAESLIIELNKPKQ